MTTRGADPFERTLARIAGLLYLVIIVLVDGRGYLSAFDPGEIEALALLALDLHGYGYLIGGAFFGVHCALLAYLLARSPLFPTVIGVLLGVASAGYLVESFTYFLFPSYEAVATALVVVTAGVAEVSLCLWLLVRGVRQPVATSPEV